MPVSFKVLMTSLATAVILLVCSLLLLPQSARTAFATTAAPVTGYAWSDTAGWIDLNCSNTGTCGTSNFSLNIAANGDLSGYAWSDTVGWVSANAADTAGCPSVPCQAHIHLGVVTGWLKALSGGSAQSGGWDGWIRLSGGGYGVSVANGFFSGYGWGDTVIGWVDFSNARTTFDDSCAPLFSCNAGNTAVLYTDTACNTTAVDNCVTPRYCSAGTPTCVTPSPVFNAGTGTTGHLKASPQIVPKNTTATVSWNVSNVTSCTVTGTSGQSWTGASGSHATLAITQQTTYTLSCTGLDGSSVNETQIINLVPVFQEL